MNVQNQTIRRVAYASLLVAMLTCSQAQAWSGWRLVDGSPLGGLNGIRVAGDSLIVVSAIGGTVSVVNRLTGQITDTFGREYGVFGPDDVAIGPDGSVYITEFFTGVISRLETGGITALPVAQIGRGANAIAFSPEGRLFASQVFLGDALYEIYLDGRPPRLVAEGLAGLNGFDFGPDGMIYAPQWFLGTVVRVDPESGAVELLFDGFTPIAAVKFGPDGALYAVEQDPGRIWRLDLESGERTIVAQGGGGADNLDFGFFWEIPLIYVTNAHNGSIQLVIPGLGWVFPLVRGGLSMAGGIATRGLEFFVADGQSMRTYGALSGVQHHQEHAGLGLSDVLATPQTVGRWGDNLVVTSWFSNTVQTWDPDTETLLNTDPGFQIPLNAIGFGEDVLVAELGSGCVTQWSPDAEVHTAVACGFLVPAGLAADQNNAYVADQATGVISQVIAEGEPLTPPRVVTDGIMAPEGLALAPNGDLLVYEAGAERLTQLDAETGEQIGVLLDGLPAERPGVPGYPPTWLFNGVAVNELGLVYVTTNGRNRVMLTGLGYP